MRKVYLDNAAAAPILPEVAKAMQPFLEKYFGNPSSLHSFGEEPRNALERSRGSVAKLIGADPQQIIFTSSGSEANNLALKGIALANSKKKGNHLVVSSIDHFSVLNSAKTLKKLGFEVTHLPVDKFGLVDPQELRKGITKETVLVSIIYANNEIGTIEPIRELVEITREHDVPFHTDAVAVVGNIAVNVDELKVNSLSLAANQFGGPSGVGALYVRKGTRLMALIDGGVQEGGKRAGTENMPPIVGMGIAAEIAQGELDKKAAKLIPLRDRLIRGLTERIEFLEPTGHPEKRLPGHASVVIKFIEGESMLMFLDMEGIATASGSACTSKALKASHVLTAIGIPQEVSHGSLVFTFGLETTENDIKYVLDTLPPIVERLRKMSPLYRKFLEEGKRKDAYI